MAEVQVILIHRFTQIFADELNKSAAICENLRLHCITIMSKFPEWPSTYACKFMSLDEAQQVIEMLPAVLQRILGDADLIIYYGWDCKLHNDLLYLPMREKVKWLSAFITDSVTQHIVRPGQSDVWFEVPDKRLVILFCHEGDIHIGGQDKSLADSFIRQEPFASRLVPPHPDSQ